MGQRSKRNERKQIWKYVRVGFVEVSAWAIAEDMKHVRRKLEEDRTDI
jgi:hypothetical protein